MKIIDEINKRIDLLRRIDEAKKTLDTLTINWATDPKDMEFEKLYGGGSFSEKDKFLRMDKIEIEPNPNKETIFSSVMDSDRMVNLIELIATGKKIVPPLYLDICIVRDGVKVIKEHKSFIDGFHRQCIAAFLQLTEIPVVVFERIESYLFTPGKWSFEAKDIIETYPGGGSCKFQYLEATSTNGNMIEFSPKQNHIYLADDFDFIKIEIS